MPCARPPRWLLRHELLCPNQRLRHRMWRHGRFARVVRQPFWKTKDPEMQKSTGEAGLSHRPRPKKVDLVNWTFLNTGPTSVPPHSEQCGHIRAFSVGGVRHSGPAIGAPAFGRASSCPGSARPSHRPPFNGNIMRTFGSAKFYLTAGSQAVNCAGAPPDMRIKCPEDI
jgi:hypothetical protein